ncbi:hypothetical protein FYJ38_18680 [Clostridium sp. WB02_MRS01]|uniref:hypothetical protein n=1 Tax=Clostridium sp. WB02_MRS01 TaxID=2605777 RepID=UPI0012B1D749|nr:hypothetical protein [Clostridium sp. WB02_MRS01]MSS10652.1 hypothetical protein [Clostridium sp. WB02_MRS01]
MEEYNQTNKNQEKIAEKASAAGIVKNNRRRKKGKKKALLLILLLLIVAGAGGGYWWYTHHQVMDATTKYWFDKLAKDGSLQGKTPTEVQELLNSVVEEGMFNVSMNAKAVFNNGKSEGSIGLENIPQNRYFCRVIIRRDDTNEVLYESKGLKPGQYIDKIKLKKNLPAGNYDCTAQVIATDPESLDDIGQVQVKIQVSVLN